MRSSPFPAIISMANELLHPDAPCLPAIYSSLLPLPRSERKPVTLRDGLHAQSEADGPPTLGHSLAAHLRSLCLFSEIRATAME